MRNTGDMVVLLLRGLPACTVQLRVNKRCKSRRLGALHRHKRHEYKADVAAQIFHPDVGERNLR